MNKFKSTGVILACAFIFFSFVPVAILIVRGYINFIDWFESGASAVTFGVIGFLIYQLFKKEN